jgi:hypothetical protein
MRGIATTALAIGVLVGSAAAQPAARILLGDRTSDTIWLLSDCNANGTIDEPSEITAFFSGANAAGTPFPSTASVNTIAARSDGFVLLGDIASASRRWIWAQDKNLDGDAQDAGESGMYLDPTNAAGLILTTQSGVTFDASGVPYFANSGSGSGATANPDALYRCPDNNNDNSANSAGEAAVYAMTGAFGGGNSASFAPNQIVFAPDGYLYMRNSVTNFFNIWRFRDNSGPPDNDADDAGESKLFLDSTNASGVTLLTGLSMDVDRGPNGAGWFYTIQSAGGGVTQIVHFHDANSDEDAQDMSEAALALNANLGVSGAFVMSLKDGRVLISEVTNNRILAFKDAGTFDGVFDPATEQTTFFANSSGLVLSARPMAILYNPADVDQTMIVDSDDLFAFLDLWFAQNGTAGAGLSADINHSFNVDADDLFAFLDKWFVPCP